jgi:DNA-binding GntR family transcriptional regulator
LAAENLVSIVPRRGIFVADISLTDLQKVFELRMNLEGFCARLAARRITTAQLEQMRSVMAELNQDDTDDGRTLMAIDEKFHTLLYKAADNEFLFNTLSSLHALSFRIWHLVLDRLGSVRGAMEQHIEITHALEKHDEQEAEKLLQQHVFDFHSAIKAVL